MEEFVDAAFKGGKRGDVDVDSASEEKFMRERKDNIGLAVLAVGQEEDFLHFEMINTFSGMKCGVDVEWDVVRSIRTYMFTPGQ